MRASALLVAACLMGLAQTASADWRRDYDLGRRAIDDQRWEEAEQLMRSALREDDEPSARKRFQGARFDVYVPHFYAGLAAARRGDCTAAAELWSHTATRRVVDDTASLAAQYREAQAACNRQLAQTPPPTSAAAPASAPSQQPAASTGAAQTPARPTTTRPTASAPPATAPSTSAPPATQPRPTQQAPAAAAATNPAPAALLSLVEAYLAGRSDQVLRFDPGSLSDPRAQAQAYLLRAATRHGQALLQDERLDSARDDIRIARQLDARLTPDESLFSPRFRILWRDTR